MTVPPFTLAGKRALVTGAASGIGAATVEVLASLGAKVALADIRADGFAAVQAVIGKCPTVIGDVAVEADCERMVAEAASALGGLDVVVNSAGIVDEVKPALDREMGPWQRIMDVNLRGTYQICRAAGRIMVAQKSGSIVNIASVNGERAWPRRTAYGPSKAAIRALTRSLSGEWGPHGVRINAVAPGYIATPMIAGLVEAGKVDLARLEARTPLIRLGTPAEVGQAIAFLASDWASFITGETLFVDGGWEAFGGAGDVRTF